MSQTPPATDTSSQPSFWSRPGFVLLLLCLAGLAVRLYHLGEKSLWSDEFCTLATAFGNNIDPVANPGFDPGSPIPASAYLAKAATSHGLYNWGATVEALRDNIHPPLFFWMMNPILHTFGTSAESLRSLAVLFSVAAIPAIYWVGRQMGGVGVGLLAAMMLAFSGFQIDHAQDARQYTWVTLLALISSGLFLSLLNPANSHQNRNWILWSLCAVAGIYSQYFYGLFIGVQYVYGLLLGPNLAFRRNLLLGFGILLVGFFPWSTIFQGQLEFIRQQGHYTQGLWDAIQLPEILWRRMSELLLLKSVWGKFLLLGILSVGLWAKRGAIVAHFKAPSRLLQWLKTPVGYVFIWLVGLFTAQILMDVLKDAHTLSIRRYTMLAALPVYLLVGWLLVQITQWKRWAGRAAMAVLGGSLLWNAGATVSGMDASSDEFRLSGAWIAQHKQPGDVVLIHKSGAMAVGLAYYLPPDTPMLGISPGSPADVKLPHLASSGVWVVRTHSGKSLQTALETQLALQGYQPVSQQKFPGIQINQLRREPHTPILPGAKR